jgi:hypothetical protein
MGRMLGIITQPISTNLAHKARLDEIIGIGRYTL